MGTEAVFHLLLETRRDRLSRRQIHYSLSGQARPLQKHHEGWALSPGCGAQRVQRALPMEWELRLQPRCAEPAPHRFHGPGQRWREIPRHPFICRSIDPVLKCWETAFNKRGVSTMGQPLLPWGPQGLHPGFPCVTRCCAAFQHTISVDRTKAAEISPSSLVENTLLLSALPAAALTIP